MQTVSEQCQKDCWLLIQLQIIRRLFYEIQVSWLYMLDLLLLKIVRRNDVVGRFVRRGNIYILLRNLLTIF
jgi:hypothetical protein